MNTQFVIKTHLPHVHVWRPEVDGGCLLQLLSSFLRQSLQEPGTCHFSKAGLASELEGASCFHLCSAGTTGTCHRHTACVTWVPVCLSHLSSPTLISWHYSCQSSSSPVECHSNKKVPQFSYTFKSSLLLMNAFYFTFYKLVTINGHGHVCISVLIFRTKYPNKFIAFHTVTFRVILIQML